MSTQWSLLQILKKNNNPRLPPLYFVQNLHHTKTTNKKIKINVLFWQCVDAVLIAYAAIIIIPATLYVYLKTKPRLQLLQIINHLCIQGRRIIFQFKASLFFQNSSRYKKVFWPHVCFLMKGERITGEDDWKIRKKASSPNARKQKRKSKNGFGLEKASKERIFSKKNISS